MFSAFSPVTFIQGHVIRFNMPGQRVRTRKCFVAICAWATMFWFLAWVFGLLDTIPFVRTLKRFFQRRTWRTNTFTLKLKYCWLVLKRKRKRSFVFSMFFFRLNEYLNKKTIEVPRAEFYTILVWKRPVTEKIKSSIWIICVLSIN